MWAISRVLKFEYRVRKPPLAMGMQLALMDQNLARLRLTGCPAFFLSMLAPSSQKLT